MNGVLHVRTIDRLARKEAEVEEEQGKTPMELKSGMRLIKRNRRGKTISIILLTERGAHMLNSTKQLIH